MTSLLTTAFCRNLAEEHRRWLSKFDPQHGRNWDKMLKADEEAALCEAGVRRRLEGFGVTVEPNESLADGKGGPDFRCNFAGKKFYVELTCIRVATAEAKTDTKDEPKREPTPVNVFGMTEAIFAEAVNKAKQCSNLDAPALVAVGTFHAIAARMALKKVLLSAVLTGKTQISWDVDMDTRTQVGDTYVTTSLDKAAFLRPDTCQDIGYARSSISGILVCDLRSPSAEFRGVLHPNAVRPFPPDALPAVEFAQLEIDPKSKNLSVTWPNGMFDD